MDINLSIKPEAVAWLAITGYDPAYGARPLKRVIQRYLENPIANLILRGAVEEHNQIKIGATNNGLIINGEVIKKEAA